MVAANAVKHPELLAEASPLIEIMWGIVSGCSEKEPVMRPEMVSIVLHMSELASSTMGFEQDGLLRLHPAAASELQPWSRRAIAVPKEPPILQRGRGRRTGRQRGSRRRTQSSSRSSSPASSPEPSLGRGDEHLETAFDADADAPTQQTAVACETVT